MLDAGFLWIFSQFASVLKGPPSAIKKLDGSVLTFKLLSASFTSDVAKEFLAFPSTSGHASFRAVADARPTISGFADSVAVLVDGAMQKVIQSIMELCSNRSTHDFVFAVFSFTLMVLGGI